MDTAISNKISCLCRLHQQNCFHYQVLYFDGLSWLKFIKHTSTQIVFISVAQHQNLLEVDESMIHNTCSYSTLHTRILASQTNAHWYQFLENWKFNSSYMQKLKWRIKVSILDNALTLLFIFHLFLSHKKVKSVIFDWLANQLTNTWLTN